MSGLHIMSTENPLRKRHTEVIYLVYTKAGWPLGWSWILSVKEKRVRQMHLYLMWEWGQSYPANYME